MWQREIHNLQFKERKSISKGNIGDKACAERDQEVKKRLVLNRIDNGVTLG